MSCSKRIIRNKECWVADYNVTKNKKVVFRKRRICDTKAEAKEYENRFKDEYKKLTNTLDLTLDVLIEERYIQFAEAQYSNIDTRKGFISKYNNYLSKFYLDNDLSFITKGNMEKLRVFIDNLTYSNGEGIPITLKESIWEKNKTFVNWLVERGNIPNVNYFSGLKRFCDIHKQHNKDMWEVDEFLQFLSVVDSNVEKTYFFGLYTMGTRKSELNNFKYKDVNELSKKASISMQYKDKSHGETILKTDSSNRSVPLTNVFIGMVNKLRLDLKEKGLTDEQIDEMYIFTNDKGDVIPRETLRRHFKEYIKLSKVRDIRIHDLRGSFATRMIDEIGNMELVRQLLGHADIRTTAVYVRVTNKGLNKVRDANEIDIDGQD